MYLPPKFTGYEQYSEYVIVTHYLYTTFTASVVFKPDPESLQPIINAYYVTENDRF